jgi:hypothetical protein
LGVFNGGKRSTGRGACRNGMLAGVGVAHSIIGLIGFRHTAYVSNRRKAGIERRAGPGGRPAKGCMENMRSERKFRVETTPCAYRRKRTFPNSLN